MSQLVVTCGPDPSAPPNHKPRSMRKLHATNNCKSHESWEWQSCRPNNALDAIMQHPCTINTEQPCISTGSVIAST